MEEAGFGKVKRHSLTFGITCLYVGTNKANEARSGA
jgi:hypothetical protein